MKERHCTLSGPDVIMGGDDAEQLRKAHGVYYLATNSDPPFARNTTGILANEFRHV